MAAELKTQNLSGFLDSVDPPPALFSLSLLQIDRFVLQKTQTLVKLWAKALEGRIFCEAFCELLFLRGLLVRLLTEKMVVKSETYDGMHWDKHRRSLFWSSLCLGRCGLCARVLQIATGWSSFFKSANFCVQVASRWISH